MVSAAWAQGAPAIIQRAEQPVLRSSSVDALLLAYGSHHIPVELRQAVANEAYRILRPGGIFVLHDFLRGSAAERWFAEICHPYSLTGHDFTHFTYSEIRKYLAVAGFANHRVMDLDDSYTVTGATEEAASNNMGEYLVKMYGLGRAERERGADDACHWAADQARLIFRYARNGVSAKVGGVSYDEAEHAWRLTIPRRAAVGIGYK
jgi:SAM-dependent methyltransferase